MTPNLESDLLRTLVAIADTGNFTRASEIVGRTQSAVSVQMKKLEEVVGETLFERGPRGVKLTAPGERLVSDARRILSLLDQAAESLRLDPLDGICPYRHSGRVRRNHSAACPVPVCENASPGGSDGSLRTIVGTERRTGQRHTRSDRRARRSQSDRRGSSASRSRRLGHVTAILPTRDETDARGGLRPWVLVAGMGPCQSRSTAEGVSDWFREREYVWSSSGGFIRHRRCGSLQEPNSSRLPRVDPAGWFPAASGNEHCSP